MSIRTSVIWSSASAASRPSVVAREGMSPIGATLRTLYDCHLESDEMRFSKLLDRLSTAEKPTKKTVPN